MVMQVSHLEWLNCTKVQLPKELQNVMLVVCVHIGAWPGCAPSLHL